MWSSRAFGGGFGADAVITGVLFAAFGAGMVAVSRRRWRVEDAGYRPLRLFYAGATTVIFMIAAAMFVGAVVDESARGSSSSAVSTSSLWVCSA